MIDDAGTSAIDSAATPASEPERIWVRSTVTLRDLPCGGEALVDPADPEIAEYLEYRLLVPLEHDAYVTETETGDGEPAA